MIKLADKLRNMKMSSFKFIAFSKQMTIDKKTGAPVALLVLELESPIESVIGSNGPFSPAHNRTIPYSAEDVTQIRVNIDMIDKYEAEWHFDMKGTGDEEEFVGTGSYGGNLQLDVSKSENVWLVDKLFKDLKTDYFKEKGNQKLSEMLKRNMKGGDKK